jgi:hypothetical protein
MSAGDSFQEVTYTNWFSRIRNSIGGALIGILLFLVSFVVLFWNEGRAVDTARSLEEAGGAVVAVATDKVDPANDGKLVHLTGEAKTDETLTDEAFGISAQAIRLIRQVEMYQWKEEKKSESRNKIGGGQETVTTYTYTKIWSGEPIDSTQFKEAAKYQNPKEWSVKTERFNAKEVKVGAFVLSLTLVAKMTSAEKLPVTEEQFKKLPEAKQKEWKLADGTLFKSADPSNPDVGNLRVTFNVVKPQKVSIMSEQKGNSFVPFQPKSAKATIDMLDVGDKSAKQMLTEAEQQNTALTWILRLVGFVVMGVGIYMVLAPLQTFANVLPFLGGIVGFVLGAFSCVCAGSLSSVTIAIAWLFYRPLIGIGLLAVAALGAVGLFFLIRWARSNKPAPAR